MLNGQDISIRLVTTMLGKPGHTGDQTLLQKEAN
jgi:hypothetical protein